MENLRAQVAGAGPWERLEPQVRASEVVLAHAGPAVGRQEPLRPLGKESWCQAWGLFLGGQAALEMFCRNQRAMANHSCPGNAQWAAPGIIPQDCGVRSGVGSQPQPQALTRLQGHSAAPTWPVQNAPFTLGLREGLPRQGGLC